MNWSLSLTYFISPRNGPMRRMETLLDANRALSKDLGFKFLKEPHTAAGSKYLVPGARTNIGTLAGAWCDTLTVRGGCYGSNGNHPNDNTQMRLHV
jgi:hypothetical protein